MGMTSEQMQRLIDAGATAEQLLVFTQIIEERQAAELSRKEKERERKRRYRETGQGRDRDGTETGQGRDRDGTPPSQGSFPPTPPLSPNSPPSKRNPKGFPKSSPKSGNRGTRIATDWKLPDEWGEWAEQMGLPPPEIVSQARKFHDYWLSKSGTSATKVDWQATWRNWIRNYLENYRK